MLNDRKSHPFDQDAFVYVRHLEVDEIQDLIPEDAMEGVGSPEDLFIVSSATGEQLAIVEGRDAAFAAARMHNLQPLSVH